jgi:hypothetical protein
MQSKSSPLWAAVFMLILTLAMGPAQSALAGPTWVEGQVTAPTYVKDGIRHLQVEDKDYILMKDARIWLHYEDRPGAFNERPLNIHNIRPGNRVMISVDSYRVYQVIVLD